MSVIQEFKQFAVKGNAVDLAVGVVIGAAFGSIVKSLVDDIIMPIVGILTGGIDFSNKLLVLKQATADTAAVTVNYGLFINSVISFLIIAFSIFIVIKQMNRLMKKVEDKPQPEDPKPAKDIQLLTEIRDLLKKSK